MSILSIPFSVWLSPILYLSHSRWHYVNSGEFSRAPELSFVIKQAKRTSKRVVAFELCITRLVEQCGFVCESQDLFKELFFFICIRKKLFLMLLILQVLDSPESESYGHDTPPGAISSATDQIPCAGVFIELMD